MRKDVAGALLLAAVACHRSTNALQGVGTIEATEVDVAPMIVARVERVLVEEGAHVRIGDTLVVLTQASASSGVDAARARVATAQAQLADLEAGARAPELQRAQSELAAAQADATRAVTELRRIQPLAATHDVSAQQLDAARAAAQTAAARRDAAAQSLQLLQEGTRPERIAAARADVANARAALAAAQGTAAELALVAPIDGVVLSKNADPGEVVVAGQPALTLGDVAHPWVRIFVGDHDIARVRVGERASILLDGTTAPASGHVVAVSDRAEFTPRIALTDEERADLMFGVKVAVDDNASAIKPGLPATVTLLGDSARSGAAH
jgi:membrane fusion protein YbhG